MIKERRFKLTANLKTGDVSIEPIELSKKLGVCRKEEKLATPRDSGRNADSRITPQMYPDELMEAVAAPIFDSIASASPGAVQMSGWFDGEIDPKDACIELKKRGATPELVGREIAVRYGRPDFGFNNAGTKAMHDFLKERVEGMWPEEE